MLRVAREFDRQVRLRNLPFFEDLGGVCEECGEEKSRRWRAVIPEQNPPPTRMSYTWGPRMCVLCLHDRYATTSGQALLTEALEQNGVNVGGFLDQRQPARRRTSSRVPALRRSRRGS